MQFGAEGMRFLDAGFRMPDEMAGRGEFSAIWVIPKEEISGDSPFGPCDGMPPQMGNSFQTESLSPVAGSCFRNPTRKSSSELQAAHKIIGFSRY